MNTLVYINIMSAEKVIKLKIYISKYASGFSWAIAPITVLTVFIV